MNKKVEGLYPSVEEAVQAVDRLREKGYTDEDITIVSNEEVRDRLLSSTDAEITSEEDDAAHSDEPRSFWDSIKNAFTLTEPKPGESNDDNEENLVNEYREEIKQGYLIVLVNANAEVEGKTTHANTQSNTVGPEGVRNYEDEQEVESKRGIDQELTTDELEEYERRQ